MRRFVDLFRAKKAPEGQDPASPPIPPKASDLPSPPAFVSAKTDEEKPRSEGSGDDIVDTREIEERVIEVLRNTFDPEIPVSIYELGLVYETRVENSGAVLIRMTLTSPACPVAGTLPPEVESKVRSIAGVTAVTVDLVWDPPWSPALMSEAARLQLGMM